MRRKKIQRVYVNSLDIGGTVIHVVRKEVDARNRPVGREILHTYPATPRRIAKLMYYAKNIETNVNFGYYDDIEGITLEMRM